VWWFSSQIQSRGDSQGGVLNYYSRSPLCCFFVFILFVFLCSNSCRGDSQGSMISINSRSPLSDRIHVVPGGKFYSRFR